MPGGYDAEAEAVYTNATGRAVYYQRCLIESEGPIHWVRRTGADSVCAALLEAKLAAGRRGDAGGAG